MSMASDQDYKSESVAVFNAPLIQDSIIENNASMARKFLNSVDDYSSSDSKSGVTTLSSASLCTIWKYIPLFLPITLHMNIFLNLNIHLFKIMVEPRCIL